MDFFINNSVWCVYSGINWNFVCLIMFDFLYFSSILFFLFLPLGIYCIYLLFPLLFLSLSILFIFLYAVVNQFRNVCPSLHLEPLVSHWTYFRDILHWEYFTEMCLYVPFVFKWNKNKRCFTTKNYVQMWLFRLFISPLFLWLLCLPLLPNLPMFSWLQC
jgi:hypothetical protein